MPVVAGQPVVVEAHRRIEEQLVAGPGDGDVEQPLFLGQPGRGGQRHVAGHGTIDQVGQVHHGPFEALGRMYGRDDQEVLILPGRPGEIRGGHGGVERQLDQRIVQ